MQAHREPSNATKLAAAEAKLAELNRRRNVKARAREAARKPSHPCAACQDGLGCLIHKPLVVGMRAGGQVIGGNKVSGMEVAVRA